MSDLSESEDRTNEGWWIPNQPDEIDEDYWNAVLRSDESRGGFMGADHRRYHLEVGVNGCGFGCDLATAMSFHMMALEDESDG